MNNSILLQSFAVDKEGRIRSVDDVSRGLACDCLCPSCGEKVIARQGEIREWHFAHSSGVECDGAAESALHLAAKQILVDKRGMNLPEITEVATVNLPDGRTGTAQAVRQSAWLDFQSVELEMTYGEIIPDVVVRNGDELLFIEIAVTHFVDQDKTLIIESMNIPTIEIDLSVLERDKWDWELLEEVVIDSVIFKHWLHYADSHELKSKAKELALKVANACPVPENSTFERKKPTRTRFWVGSRMVDVVERPFGLAIWSPYDPIFNETIKSLMRVGGGRWQPKFKNWLLPLEAKEWIFDELNTLSGKPPEVMS